MRLTRYNAAASRPAETMSPLESLWHVPLLGCSPEISKPGRLFEKLWLAVHDDPSEHLRTSETRQYVRQLIHWGTKVSNIENIRFVEAYVGETDFGDLDFILGKAVLIN